MLCSAFRKSRQGLAQQHRQPGVAEGTRARIEPRLGGTRGGSGKFLADHGGGPAEGLRVHGGDGAFSEAEPVLDFFAADPVAGFEAANQVEGEAAGAVIAGEGGFHCGGDGEGFEDAAERHLEERIEKREHAEEVELRGLERKRGGEEFAEVGAGENHGDERGRTMGGEGTSHGDGDHLANSVVADQEEGFTDGGDDAGMALEGGVGEAEDAIAEGGVGGDELFDFAEAGGIAMELGDEFQVDEVILRNDAGAEQDRLGEEVSLKEGAALTDGDAELDFGFDFLCEEAGAGAGRHGIDFAAEIVTGRVEIEFDEVGEVEEGSAGGLGKEAVEGKAIALFFEGEAAVDQLGIGLDVLEDFEDGGCGREQGDEAFGEGIAGAVDEGGGAGGVGNEKEPVVDDLAGGLFGIAGEVVGFAGAVEELVAEKVTLGAKDGLAAEKAAGSGDGGMGRGGTGCFGRGRGCDG